MNSFAILVVIGLYASGATSSYTRLTPDIDFCEKLGPRMTEAMMDIDREPVGKPLDATWVCVEVSDDKDV